MKLDCQLFELSGNVHNSINTMKMPSSEYPGISSSMVDS